jgi:hypothetical protein
MKEDSQTDHFSCGSIVESTHWMVLHRPSEPAQIIGKVKIHMEGNLVYQNLDHCFRCVDDTSIERAPAFAAYYESVSDEHRASAPG